MSDAKAQRNPWSWIPTLYFAEGLPYIVVMVVSVIMYKRMGVSNTEIALYTSWLYLPWVIKPLWSPLVDLVKTKRFWIVAMQLLLGAGLAGVALTLPTDDYLRYSLAFLWLLAFSSATHDIAADGFYMLGLSQHDQTWFVGIRSTFYRLAMITGQGFLVMFAGYIESTTGLPTLEVALDTQPGAAAVEVLDPAAFATPTDAEPLRLVASPASLTLDPALQDGAWVDSVLAAAKAWNEAQGFYPTDTPTVAGEDAGPSWWRVNVSQPLGAALKRWFGPEEAPPSSDGRQANVGVVLLSLSGPVPEGESVVVNFGRASGDASIRLVEGERFTFTGANADKPFMAVVQLDPKLDRATAAQFEARSGNIPLAWSITFYLMAALFVIFFFYHRFMLPHPATDVPTASSDNLFAEFVETFVSFFRKPGIGVTLAFLLFYRFAEAQLVKLASPFLLDAREVGGLALTTGEVGFVYGTVGIIALTVGGILGGFLAARDGLKRWLWWMVVAINLPNAAYLYLSYAMPESFFLVNLAVAVEQFGYGFGFTAYMLYMIYVAEGEHKTAHFALCTGFMALGMMVPGMFSGWLQEMIGYQPFFAWVLLATLPGFLVSALIKIDPDFGKKKE